MAKAFDKHKSAFLLLMDEKVAVVPIKEEKKFKNFGISQKYINKNFLEDAKEIDIAKLKQNGYLLGKEFFFTYIDIKDFQGKYLGVALLGKPLSIVTASIEDAKQIINTSLIIIVFMTLIIIFVSSMLIKKLVSKPLGVLKEGLDNFFLFLQNKQDHAKSIELKTNDEFAYMASSLNENIAVSAKLHEEINELNYNLEQRVEEKTAKVKTLLDNVGQGFLTFNENFLIDKEYSQECETLLGQNLKNQDITNLLFKDEKKKEVFKSSLLNASNVQKDIIRKSYLSLLPINIILNKRAIKLEYKILDKNKFLLILTNITTQIKLERKMKKEQEIMQMVIAVVSESETFYETKKEYIKFIDTYKELLDTSKSALHNISNMYRTIHTFKGSFSQLYMQDVVSFLHGIESEISKLSKDSKATNEELLSLLGSYDFKENIDKTLFVIDEVLGDEFVKSENYLKINYTDIINLQDKVNTLLSDKKASAECEDILCQIQNLSSQKLYNLFTPYISLTSQLAKRLEKEIYPLDILGDEELFISDKIKPFIKSLIHVFRNSVDHGIESPDKRIELDKDEVGTLLCSYKKEDETLYITISDDGAGINIEKIKEKLTQKGIEYDGFTDSEIYSFIFDDNFSTKDEITDISGRGVGMSAVKNELNKLKGEIKINSQINKGTSLEFIIPCGE